MQLAAPQFLRLPFTTFSTLSAVAGAGAAASIATSDAAAALVSSTAPAAVPLSLGGGSELAVTSSEVVAGTSLAQGAADYVTSLSFDQLGILGTGCIAGFASGLLGIGGGTIVTPLLAVFSGMPQTAVLGTSLAAMVVPSLVGLAQHHRLGNVDWVMAAGLAAGTMMGGYLGSNLAVQAPPGVLEGAFAVGMLLLGHKTLASARAAAAAAQVAKAAAGK